MVTDAIYCTRKHIFKILFMLIYIFLAIGILNISNFESLLYYLNRSPVFMEDSNHLPASK